MSVTTIRVREMFTLLLFMIAAIAGMATEAAAAKQPNVIVVLADDMGFSDLGCYGGEIETPHIDALAANGLKFTQFYNTARCWPTRAALMTGYYPHQANMAMNFGPAAPEAYSGIIPQSARMIPELLKTVGYRTYHVGKWHLNRPGRTSNETWPLERGYDHSYFMLRQDNFHNPRLLFDDRTAIERPGDTDPDYYVTTAFTDQAIRRLKEHEQSHAEKPFFLYLAHTAPHFPLHAQKEDVQRFLGRYREGWDKIREARHQRQKEMGLLDCELSPRDPFAKPWDELTSAEQEEWDARMATYAAMIYRLDAGVGRIVEQLKSMNAFEDTLIFVLSDNGSSAEYIVRGDGHEPGSYPGSAESYRCLEVAWSNAANTPFREHKMWTQEGGIATPLVVHWPNGLKARGEQTDTMGHVIDLLPTICAAAGAEYPKEFEGKPTQPLPGKDLGPVLTGKRPALQRDYLFWEHQGHKAIREGNWKLVADRGEQWELYNLKDDRSELHNLAGEKSALVLLMAAKWQKEAIQQGVVEWNTFPQAHRSPGADYREK
ncbi:arylsulfatase [Rubinisphaera margarita]|uniref:arylsulfatase n=1 Tax=Rubinisphaera margarita TaxID=2909586 RepID=UPI001EE7B8B4|nr:arylsulfatase [Rubinisphaera margarita]MCG6158364.1 arylsulfatase [Rubinisphaera margarita]